MPSSLDTQPDIGSPDLEFLDANFDAADTDSIRRCVDRLIEMPRQTPEQMVRWLESWSELDSAIEGQVARRYIAMTCDTADEAIRAAYVSYESDVVPFWRVQENRLNEAYLESPARPDLGERYLVFERRRKTAAEIFREENTRLKAREKELGAQFEEIQGAVTVVLDGEEMTAQRATARYESLDRHVRRTTFEALAERRLADAPAVEGIFAQLVDLRDHIGRNAGFENYRDFRFAEMNRFDYRPEDCCAFHDAVEKVVVPTVLRLAERRRTALGIDRLHSFDTRVGTSGRPPVRAFDDEAKYIERTRKLFAAVDPVFAEEFDVLVRNQLLDLMSRPGKAPGGYNYPVEDLRVPFIFFNAVGVHDDIQTLLHEGGHAFHTLACRQEPLREYREAPMEFCEVASMAMELFGLEQIGEIYSAEDAREIERSHLEGILESFSWFAIIDCFQHWIYTHPAHSIEERRAEWVRIYERFAPHISWEGYEENCRILWHKQSHLFGYPFYYIEYAIAQIGALQAWQHFDADRAQAVADYRAALRLGGSKPLPELFQAAGLRFAMDESILRQVIPPVLERIEELT